MAVEVEMTNTLAYNPIFIIMARKKFYGTGMTVMQALHGSAKALQCRAWQ